MTGAGATGMTVGATGAAATPGATAAAAIPFGLAAAFCWMRASAARASGGGSSALRAARPICPSSRPMITSVSPVRNSPSSQNCVVLVNG